MRKKIPPTFEDIIYLLNEVEWNIRLIKKEVRELIE